MLDRLSSVRHHMTIHYADASILSSLVDIRWVCGFTGSNGLLIVTQDGAHLVTDGRYAVQADGEVRGATVHIAARSLVACAADEKLCAGISRAIVQADHLTLDLFENMQDAFSGIEWTPVPGLLQHDVAVKAAYEIEAIRRAQTITDDVFDYLTGFIRPGMTEREVAAEIVYQHLRRGATGMSFEPIVASGEQGALPHARPSERRLTAGDMVVLDFGCFVDGYASDMTRTIAIGEPSDEACDVYQVVLEAQERALESARPGMTAKALDAVARGLIASRGYGPAFSHSLGHGVGLQIHEWPSVSSRTEEALPRDAVITIEPGIYLAGRFGVRIEDMIVLREEGAENLTRSPRQLLRL